MVKNIFTFSIGREIISNVHGGLLTMDKKKFFDILKSLKMTEIDDSKEYETLVEFGITATFKHFSKTQAKFAARYLRR